MIRKNRFIFCLISLLLAAITMLSGCSAGSPDNILDIGADAFAVGKTEDDYSLINSGTLLDSLIDDFSGSYYQPTGQSMTDDEYDDVKDQIEDSSEEEGASDSKVYKIGSYEDLEKAFYEVYNDTKTQFEFVFVNGYSVNLLDVVEKIYRNIQRKDPIAACGVESWQWGNRGVDYIVKINYFFKKKELVKIKEETVKLVDEAVNKINAFGKSDYEIICAVNKYLCETVVYPDSKPYEPITHTAYGALKNGLAVCEGYTCAAKLILNKFSIKCDIQTGVCTNGEGHAWNLVQLENNWYQMDITWNDGSRNITDYLLVTDEYMKKSRSWEEADYPATPSKPYAA